MDTTIFQLFNKNITNFHLIVSSSIIFFLAALKYYTSGGVCRVHKDLTGKVAVVTGGNTGIGKETVLDLVEKNCTVIIGARDKAKLEQTLKEIVKVNPKADATYAILDLGDRDSIQQFAKFVKNNCTKIDYLINNAGVMMIPQRKQTKNGLQMQIGINHFGHFYLTYLLFSHLKKADHFRIINLSSRAHFGASKGINFDDIHHKNHYSDLKVYSQSKLANIYFTRLLQNKIDSAHLNGISVCIHPGVVRTELLRYKIDGLLLNTVMAIISPIYYLMTKNPKQGAQTTLYTVYEDQNKLIKGEYYADCKVSTSTNVSKDLQAAEKLWKISEQTWGIKFDI